MRTLLFAALACLSSVPATAQEMRPINVGQSQWAELTDRDPIGLRARKSPYHVWTIDGRRGQRLVIDMRSDDFDTYLVLRDDEGFILGSDDDAGGSNNSRLHTVLPRNGRYRIVATGYGDSARGRYELTVAGWEAPNAPAPGAATRISFGQARDGILEPGDEIAGDGPYLDRWEIDLRSGQRVHVEMSSRDFDSYLIVRAPDGLQIAQDDDGGEEGQDAELGFRATMQGTYIIIATSYADNIRMGAYRISLSEESGNFAEPGTASPISAGESRDGRLESGDHRGRRGFQDRWTFQGRQGQVARIDVRSSRFDAYAMLLYDGMPIDSNDDGGEGQDSRLQTVLPGNGNYTIVVSQYSEGGSGGRYTLSLMFSDPPPGAGRVERITAGQRVSGRLEPGDRARSGGGYQDIWEFDARAGQEVQIEMESNDLDPFLELRDAEGASVSEDDDSGDGNSALIMTRLPRDGRYRVIARSYGEREATGFYELSLTVGGDIARPSRVLEIADGQTVLGRLERGDSVVGDSTFADIYTFRATRDGEIQIDLRSQDFDAYLMVKNSGGSTLQTDDDGAGQGTNSRITMNVRTGQSYRIFANSYGDDRATGIYRLSLRYTHR